MFVGQQVGGSFVEVVLGKFCWDMFGCKVYPCFIGFKFLQNIIKFSLNIYKMDDVFLLFFWNILKSSVLKFKFTYNYNICICSATTVFINTTEINE